MNDFEAIIRFSDGLQAKWNETANNPDDKNTFTGLQKQIKQMHALLRNERHDREQEYQKIMNDGRLTPDYIGKQRVKLDKQYHKMESMVVSGLRKDIEKMIADKLAKLDRMLVEAPSPNQVALLNAIQLRGKNISRGELMKMLPTFFRNYQSMKIFETLANAAGYRIPTPFSETDIVDLYALLDQGGNYLLECLGQVGKDTIHLHRAFFFDNADAPGNADAEFQKFIDHFDVPVQLQTRTIGKLTAAEEAVINSFFSDVDGLDPEKDSVTILRSVQKILHKHPEDIDKMMKSKYAQLVAEVQELELINKKKAEAADEQTKAAASDK